MNLETPLVFHRRRIALISNTLGAWMACRNESCRRKGRCRRADDVFPACLLPIVYQMSVIIDTCAAALPDLPPRAETEEETIGKQLRRIAKRMAGVMEEQLEELVQRRERRRERRRAR